MGHSSDKMKTLILGNSFVVSHNIRLAQRKSAGVISHPFFQLINFTKAKIWRERTPADFLFALSYMGTREAQKVDREAIMCLPRDYRLWTYTYIHTYIKSSF